MLNELTLLELENLCTSLKEFIYLFCFLSKQCGKFGNPHSTHISSSSNSPRQSSIWCGEKDSFHGRWTHVILFTHTMGEMWETEVVNKMTGFVWSWKEENSEDGLFLGRRELINIRVFLWFAIGSTYIHGWRSSTRNKSAQLFSGGHD